MLLFNSIKYTSMNESKHTFKGMPIKKDNFQITKT
jgi:hypothetical protein